MVFLTAFLFWHVRGGEQTVFRAGGTISVSGKQKTFSTRDYIGVASAYKTHDAYRYGYQIALVPKHMLQEALIVYKNIVLFDKNNTDPHGTAVLRQKIAHFTRLEDKGFLGVLPDNEWCYLSTQSRQTRYQQFCFQAASPTPPSQP